MPCGSGDVEHRSLLALPTERSIDIHPHTAIRDDLLHHHHLGRDAEGGGSHTTDAHGNDTTPVLPPTQTPHGAPLRKCETRGAVRGWIYAILHLRVATAENVEMAGPPGGRKVL